MTVVVWINKCSFCGHGHWTDQECIENKEVGDNENG